MTRLLAIIVVAAAACLVVLTINTQPRSGVVQGICIDVKTGQPIDGATVDIELNSPPDDGNYRIISHDTSRFPDLFSTVPGGWAQGSQSDADLDIAGHQNIHKTDWQAVTDSNGRFLFHSITVGSYTVSASSSGHDVQNVPLAVSEGANEPLTLTMTRNADSLTFDSPGKYWTTDEYPHLGLNGLLADPIIQLTLQRLDLDTAIKTNPKLLLQDQEAADSSRISGQIVRRWDYTINDADDEGSFYDQIQCSTPATGKLTPGIYRLTATSVDKTNLKASIIFDVTDLAVVAKSCNTNLLLHAVGIRSGNSVQGLKAYCLNVSDDTSRVLSSGSTNYEGLCELSSKGSAEDSQGIAFVRRGDEFAAAEVNFNSPGTEDEDSGKSTGVDPDAKDLRAFIYTDRPVYRPGQNVSIKGISRWYVPGAGFVVPAGSKVQLTITDAQNTTVNRQFVTTDKFGSWTASVTLSPEALTGDYTVQESIENRTSSGTFSVAAYHKPEYQVTVSFDKQRYIKGDTIVATVTGTYYFGAPMSGVAGSVDVYKQASAAGEDDETASSDSAESGDIVKSAQFVLDGNGQAKVTIDTSGKSDQNQSLDKDDNAGLSSDSSSSSSQDNDDSSQMTYTVSASVSDKSDADVTAQESAIVAEGDFSISAAASSSVANIGDSVTVTAQATDETGKPLPGKGLDVVAAYGIWSNNEDKYVSFAKSRLTTGGDGTASYVIRPTKAGLINVTFSGVDDRGNKVTDVTQVWVPDKNSDIPAQYSDMSILLDKEKYKPGDVAHVLITTAHPGPDAWVTVEGTSLYKSVIIRLKRRATQVDLPVAEDYAPGVTVAVNCVVDKQFLSSSVNLAIDDPKRALTVAVSSDKAAYHPGDTATIHLHTSGPAGNPVSAEVSLAVVDSAIFAIMPEPSGTIQDAFLPAQSDNVQTADSTETVYYGDVDKGSTNIDIRRKFPDTALWKPDIITNSSGDAAVNLQLPDTLTTWRITSYGQTADTMVGKGVSKMVVNKDLTVALEAPAFLINGDKSTLIAMVHNNTNKALNVKFHLIPAGLNTQGDLSQDIIALPGSPTELSWQISAKSTGVFLPEATVQSGQLSDGVQTTINSYPHGASLLNWTAGSALYSAETSVAVNPRALRSDTALTIRLSPTLASALPPAAEYLSSYPYGCTDSTISALIADATLYGAKGPLNLPADVSADLKQKAQRCLLRTYREQQDDGGWGWFSTDTSDTWMTCYAAYGLTLAKQSGMTINSSVLTAAVKAVSDDSDEQRAKVSYRFVNTSALSLAALVLAENGSPVSAATNLAYLNKVWEGDPTYRNTDDIAKAVLADEYIHTPPSLEQADRLMESLWQVGRETGAMLSWTEEYHSSAAYASEYAPDPAATAWTLLAAESVAPTDPRIDEAARWLAANRNDDHWNDVDDTGVVVLALSKYLASANELTPNMTVSIKMNGKPAGVVRFNTSSIGNPDSVITIPGKQLVNGVNYIDFSKTGEGRLYYAVCLKQSIAVPAPQPPSPWIETAFNHLLYPVASLPPTASGYHVKRIYMRMTTRRNFLWEDTVPTRDWQFNEGDSILVRLIVDSVRPGSRIVIDEPVPPGCRIAETSGEYDEDWSNWWDYTDVRDSDIVFFVSDLTTGRHEIDYHLIANRPGDYDVMPTSITSMVDPTLQVTGSATKVGVDGN